MKRVGHIALWAALLISVVLAPQASARSWCTTGDLSGSYAITGSRLFLPGTTGPGAGPGTGGLVLDPDSMIIGTSTERLFAGTIGSGAFAATGRISADGAGRLFAAPSAGMASVPIGTYTVNSDCTMSMSLRAEGGVGANLTGVIVNQGLEVNLIQTSLVGVVPPGTTPTTISTGLTPTLITLVRQAANNFCSNADLQGGYGAVFSGYAVSPPGTVGTMTVTPISFVGRMVADGMGHSISDAVGSQFSSNQITGTYSVRQDCSGTAQLTFPANSNMSGTPPTEGGDDEPAAVTRGMEFVILDGGRSIRFAFSGTNTVGTGFAARQ